MKKMKFFVPALAGALLMTSSCTTRLTDFTIISTKNFDLSHASNWKRTSNRTEGKHTVHVVIGIPTGIPNLKTAIDRAIESTKGAIALTDGVVYSKSWSAILYGQFSYIVEGNALVDPAYAGDLDLNKETYVSLKLNKKGEIVKQTTITEDEFKVAKEKIAKGSKVTSVQEVTSGTSN